MKCMSKPNDKPLVNSVRRGRDEHSFPSVLLGRLRLAATSQTTRLQFSSTRTHKNTHSQASISRRVTVVTPVF